jgi:peptide/nickel transport system substrate-binding protein
MRRRFGLLIALILIVVLAVGVPTLAQEDEVPGFGEGGPIVSYIAGSDPATFNPLFYGDGTSGSIISLMYPSIIGLNPETGLEEPNQQGALATGWEFDESGTVVTITLREDAFWSDGTPVTANDYVYAANVVRSGEVDSPRESMWATLADGTPAGGNITDIVALDDYTVQVTFEVADCIAFSDINNVSVVPQQEFEAVWGDDYAAMLDDPLRVPEVVFGPFGDPEFDPGARISLLPVESYADTAYGYVVPNEYIALNVPDTTVATERFLDGEFTYLAVPGPRQAELEANENFQSYRFIGNSFNFLAFNTADPANPQNGLDEEGNPIDQGLHPFLGDVRVRQAMEMAFDESGVIEGIADGNGVDVDTHTTPNSWVYDETLVYEFDREAALAMMESAGWVDDDGDTSTPLVCQGCLYATEADPEFEGTPFQITLLGGSGSDTGEQIGVFFDAQMEAIGVDVDFQQVDFNSVLVPQMLGQTYDMVLLAWSLGYPIDPDVSNFYGPASDVVGGGFNFVSFNNERLNELLEEARTVPGCDQDVRAELYQEVQQILFEQVPYIYLYVPSSLTAVQPYVDGFDPTPVSRVWNQDAWIINVP